MYCPYCGKSNEDGSVFCEHCGKSLVAGLDKERPSGSDWDDREARPDEEPQLAGGNKGGSKKTALIAVAVVAAVVAAILDGVFADGATSNNSRSGNGYTGNEQSAYYANCIFPYSSSEYLTEAEVRGLSDWQIQRAKNEIFSRNGYIFQTSAEEKAFFESQSWYHGTEPTKRSCNHALMTSSAQTSSF